jgi:RHS repeat-associated protein
MIPDRPGSGMQALIWGSDVERGLLFTPTALGNARMKGLLNRPALAGIYLAIARVTFRSQRLSTLLDDTLQRDTHGRRFLVAAPWRRLLPKPATMGALSLLFGFLAFSARADTPVQPAGTVPQQVKQIRGLADSKVSLQNGAFTSNVAIDVPGFRSITPQLQLSYSSSAGNGFAGLGWDLSGFSTIERASPNRGSPRYGQAWTSDIYLLDGEQLVPSTALGGNFSTLRESFLQISGNGSTWSVRRRDGTLMTYNPVYATGSGTFRWGLSQVQDPRGNVVNYGWTCTSDISGTRDCYPSSVSYANVVVTLNGEARTDIETFATGKRLGLQDNRLHSIVITVGGQVRNSYVLSYKTSGRTGRSLLASIQQFGRDSYTALPPTSMTYSDTQSGFDGAQDLTNSYGLNSDIWYHSKVYTGDFNGDGRTDMVLQYLNVNTPAAYLILASPNGGFNYAVNIGSGVGIHAWYNGNLYVGDFNGDGAADIIVQYPNTAGEPLAQLLTGIKQDNGGGFNYAVDLTNSYGLNQTIWFNSTPIVGDYNGDGKADLILQDKNVSHIQAILLLANASGFNSAVDITAQYGLSANIWYASTPTVGDFNGDGKTDVLFQYYYSGVPRGYLLMAAPAGGFNTVLDVTSAYGLPVEAWRCSSIVPGDFNGDGRTDLMMQRGSGCLPTSSGHYLLYAQGADSPGTSTNVMFDTAVNVTNLYGMTDALWWQADLITGDFNGDGRTDLLVKSWVAAQTDQHSLLFSTGSGFGYAVNATNLYGMNSDSWAYSNPRVGDFDGDGDEDIFVQGIWSGSPVHAQFLNASSSTANLLATINNGYGGSTAVSYEPSSTWANSNNPPLTQTVGGLVTTDGMGWSAQTVYDYSGGAWDPLERRHLGFRYVKVADPTGAFDESYFYQGESFSIGEVEYYYRKDASGGTILETHRAVTGSAAAPWVRNLTSQDDYECGGGACKEATTGFGYDQFGNNTVKIEYGDVAITGDERTTVTYYYPYVYSYLVNYPANVAVRSGTTTTGPIVAQMLTYYDNQTVNATSPSKGNATRVDRRVDAAGKFLVTTYSYDSYGNRLSETDPLNHTTSTAWATTDGLYPSSTTNALLQQTTFGWDEVCGFKIKETDVGNNTSTTWVPDNFCRRASESRADGGYTKWFYNQFGSPGSQHVREQVRDGTADDLWKTTYFDGLGRVFKVVSEADRTVLTTYDSRGNVGTVSAPYATGETIKRTTYSYDAVGRMVQVLYPDNSARKTIYGSWTETTCDELGKPTTRYRDAYHQIRRVREYLNKTCTLAPSGTLGVDIFDTAIDYNFLGQHVKTTDSKSNVSVFTLDMLGRQTQRQDPDLGVWTFIVDDGGRVTSQNDAKGQVILIDYDPVNREIDRKLPDGTVLVRKVYDHMQTQPYQVGRLVLSSYRTGITAYTYDAVGHIKGVYTNSALADAAPATAWSASWQFIVLKTYDYLGHIKTLQYPYPETITYQYDNAGRPYSVTSSLAAYVSAATYDARDHLVTRTLGNGIVETYGYDPNRLWLSSDVAKLGTAIVYNESYGYNIRGDITSRFNGQVAVDRWTYGYDDLRRLITATNSGNAAYSQTFAYDSIGRMTSQTGVGTYVYPAVGTSPAHAPKTAGTSGMIYDPNGRLTSGMGTTLQYDQQGRPAVINSELHEYDADGEQVRVNAVKFLSNLWESDATNALKTDYVYFNGARVARMQNGVVSFYHGNQIGTPDSITNSSGVVVKRETLAPYGKLLAQYHTITDSFGIAGQRQEASGLYHMGIRKMNPSLNMFVMPDPSDSTNAEEPQSLNRFAYADNRPIQLIDPDGRYACTNEGATCTKPEADRIESYVQTMRDARTHMNAGAASERLGSILDRIGKAFDSNGVEIRIANLQPSGAHWKAGDSFVAGDHDNGLIRIDEKQLTLAGSALNQSALVPTMAGLAIAHEGSHLIDSERPGFKGNAYPTSLNERWLTEVRAYGVESAVQNAINFSSPLNYPGMSIPARSSAILKAARASVDSACLGATSSWGC